jgi:endonuclease/exonuclease/phosphatase family metal-dependent hydrolase
MPAAEPIRYYDQRARAEKIPYFLASLKPDVIVLQESMTDHLHTVLSATFRTLGYIYETEQLRKRKSLVQGGVVIFSKFPILVQRQHVFHQCRGADCLSAKGFVYALIRTKESDVHIIGTHLQAWPSPEGRAARLAQARQIGEFVNRLKGPAAICGDFNEDLYSSARQLDALVSAWNHFQVLRPASDSESLFTVDSEKNPLVGADDETAYASKEFPYGCYSGNLSRLCECCPSEWLDYVCVRGMSGDMRAIPSLLSDHYPVLATVVPDEENRGKSELYRPPLKRIVISWYSWIMIVSCAILALLGVIFCLL